MFSGRRAVVAWTGFLQRTSRHFSRGSAKLATPAADKQLRNVSANRKARIELAAAYRVLERLNLHEGVCNHLTTLAPAADGSGEVMLVIPHGLHWSEVRHCQMCL